MHKSRRIDNNSSRLFHNLSAGRSIDLSSLRWPCIFPSLSRGYATVQKGPSFEPKLSSPAQARHMTHWTKAPPAVKEKDEAGLEAQAPRITFYSSQSGHVTCGENFEELPEGEEFWQIMATDVASDKSKEAKAENSSKPDCSKICYWLDIVSPSKADIQLISSKLGLHPLIVEDILAKETQEKIEVHQGVSFLAR